jgi:hypothetical protein
LALLKKRPRLVAEAPFFYFSSFKLSRGFSIKYNIIYKNFVLSVQNIQLLQIDFYLIEKIPQKDI